MYELDYSLRKEMDDRWKESSPLFQQYWYEADIDTKMATGQQDYWQSLYGPGYRNQKVLMFNKILRVINMIGGYQRKNRLATIVSAKEDGDSQTADDKTKALMWAMEMDGTYEKISETFEGSTTVGLGLISTWMDYREDAESGNIVTSRIPYNAFLMDNYWTKTDLSDCDWIWTRRYMSRQQVMSLHPKIGKDLTAIAKGYGAKDGRFQFLAQNWYQYQQDFYSYDEYWTREYRKVRKIIDRSTGEMIEWKGNKEQFQMLRMMNPNIDIITSTKPSVKLQVLINNHLVYEESRPYGSDLYPFVPFLAYHYPEVQNYAYRYQGVVRNVRDSQVELNRRRNRMLDILDSQVQSGMIIKEDALVNPEDAFLSGPGRVQFAKQSANLATDVMPIPPPQIPPSMFELQNMLDSEIMQIAGVNEELFGESANGQDMSGFLSSLRMGAALVSLQGIFDKLNQSQKQVGELFDDYIRENFSEEKIKRILGRDPTPEFFVKDFEKYNLVIEEAQLTSSQRQLQFQQAFAMKQMGLPIPTSYLLEKSTLQGKKELLEAIARDEQAAQQMQIMEFQAQQDQQLMMAQSLHAKAENDYAAAKEKITRSVSNIGLAQERAAQAIHDQAETALANAKAVHEIEQVKDDRLIKLSDFLLQMEERQTILDQGVENHAIQKTLALTSNVDADKST